MTIDPNDLPAIDDWNRLLEGKVAVVTGGGAGIGGAVTELFAAHGATVEVAEIDPDRADHIVAAVTEAGGTAHAHVVDVRTEEVDELTDWLGAVIRSTDSSLLDEWSAMFSPDAADDVLDADAIDSLQDEPTTDVTTDRRAFRALVRTRVFRWVQFAATGQWEAWSEDLTEIGNHGWNETKLREQFAEFFDQYAESGADAIGIDGDARGPSRFVVADEGDEWQVEQILADPEGHDEWYLAVTVDIAASAEAGEIVATFDGLRRR